VPNVGRAHWQRKQALAYGFCRTHKAYTKFLPSNEQKAGSLHSIQEAGQFMSGTYCIASQVCRGSKSDVAIKEVESVHFSTATWRFPPSGHQTSFFNPTPRLSRDLRILRVDLAFGVRLVWQAHACRSTKPWPRLWDKGPCVVGGTVITSKPRILCDHFPTLPGLLRPSQSKPCVELGYDGGEVCYKVYCC
jgi:hypothetical protein